MNNPHGMPPQASTLSAPAPAPPAGAPGPRLFDGVICFGGEDWWYHNRGHYDMQMMRELSRRVPVLYVNSIGMRVPRPSEGKMFLKRVKRKLTSIRRGLVRVRDTFGVFSPFVAPGPLGMRLTRNVLPIQVRAAARRMGIRAPLVWVNCPPGVEALEALAPVGVVYQRTDRYECFSNVNAGQIAGYDRRLKDRADLTVFCSRLLFDEESAACRNAAYIDHGVDYDRFAGAGRAGPGEAEPADLRAVPRPRVGFVGGIDAHTFDPPLFVEVARRLPEVSFVLVGACSLPLGWCDLSNVYLLGQRPYEDVPSYMAACDALIMPWNSSEWIKACNPVKLKEYLSTGRPVVSTGFAELARYAGFVRPAATPGEFAAAIRDSLDHPGDAEARRARVRDQTWERKGADALARLASLGILPSSGA